MAKNIGDFYGLSVLVHGSLADKTVTGRLSCTNAQDALQSLAFLLGAEYRATASQNVYFVGGSSDDSFTRIPSYGLRPEEVITVFNNKVHALGDSLIVQADQNRASQIREAMATFANRPSLYLELVVLDTTGTAINRVNDWLDSFRAGVGLASDVAKGAYGTPHLAYDFDMKALLKLVEGDSSAKIQLREQVQIMSGSKTRFNSGQILERTLFTREPYTGQDLASSIERRTVGLTVDVAATYFAGQWHLAMVLKDSGIGADKVEKTTEVSSERIIDSDEKVFLLAAFTRKADEYQSMHVPGLSKIPKIGKWFSKSVQTVQDRQFTVLARPIFTSPTNHTITIKN